LAGINKKNCKRKKIERKIKTCSHVSTDPVVYPCWNWEAASLLFPYLNKSFSRRRALRSSPREAGDKLITMKNPGKGVRGEKGSGERRKSTPKRRGREEKGGEGRRREEKGGKSTSKSLRRVRAPQRV
jgi:hypothetical protein